jgi:galactoside O-acetyltransferase
MSSFYSDEELGSLGLGAFGRNVLISRKASLYRPEEMFLGDHVRIDDFCILSGKVEIGSFVHISAYTAIYAKFGVQVDDFATLSGRCLIYSQNDDYSGEFMTNPMVPEEFLNVSGGLVVFNKYSILGAGSIVLPGVVLGEGVAVGAMSLVNKSLESWKIYAGIPARFIRERRRNIAELAKRVQDQDF